MSPSRFSKIWAMAKERAAKVQAEEVILNAFRSPEPGPPVTGERVCPICGRIGQLARRDLHVSTQHPDVAHGLREIERSLKPRAPRAVIY